LPRRPPNMLSGSASPSGPMNWSAVWGEGVEDADPMGSRRSWQPRSRMRPFRLILGGWRRADVLHAQTGPILAELLDLPQITCARSVVMGGEPESSG